MCGCRGCIQMLLPVRFSFSTQFHLFTLSSTNFSFRRGYPVVSSKLIFIKKKNSVKTTSFIIETFPCFFLRPVSQIREKRLLASSCLPTPTFNKIAPTGRIFIKVYIWGFLENMARNSKFDENLTTKRGYFT